MPTTRAKHSPFSMLGDLPVSQFLAEYWQKKPVLIRGALPDFESAVSPEELAGFALEDDVESRLIIEQPAQDPLRSSWQLRHGPLQEADFDLPESHWTLLVQAVDQLVPEVADLLQRFRFIPNWRLDDIMISYAADGGNVGPHYDHYDVFLLQAQGRRRWSIGQACGSRESLRPDTELRLLTQFEHQWEAVLEPGDMLYIPPQIAHWGVAEGPCMTYSIGFRAPSWEELILDYSEDIAADLLPHQRLSDADLPPPAHPGEISPQAVTGVRHILEKLLLNEERIAQWLATYGTTPKRGSALDHSSLPDADHHSPYVRLKARVRAAYLPDKAGAGPVQLYLNGEPYPCSLALAQALSSYSMFSVEDTKSSADRELLDWLFEQQWLWESHPAAD